MTWTTWPPFGSSATLSDLLPSTTRNKWPTLAQLDSNFKNLQVVRWVQFLAVSSGIWVLICLFIWWIWFIVQQAVSNSTSTRQGPQSKWLNSVRVSFLRENLCWLAVSNNQWNFHNSFRKQMEEPRNVKKQGFPVEYPFEIGLIPCFGEWSSWCDAYPLAHRDGNKECQRLKKAAGFIVTGHHEM